jgi:hypothetical protein
MRQSKDAGNIGYKTQNEVKQNQNHNLKKLKRGTTRNPS